MQPDRLLTLNLVRDLTLEKLAGAGGALSASPGAQQPALPSLPTVGSPTGSPTDQKQSVAGAAGIAAMGQANALTSSVAAPAGAPKGPNLVTAHAQQTAHASIRKVVQPKGGETKVAGWLDSANRVALDAQNALASPARTIQEGMNELPVVGPHIRRADQWLGRNVAAPVGQKMDQANQWIDRNVAQPVGQGVNKALNFNLGRGETPGRLLTDAAFAMPMGAPVGNAIRGAQVAAREVPAVEALAARGVSRGLAAGDAFAAKTLGRMEGAAGPRLATAGGAPMEAASVVRPSPGAGALEMSSMRPPSTRPGGAMGGAPAPAPAVPRPPVATPSPAAGASPVVTPPSPIAAATSPVPGAMSPEMQKYLAYRKYMAENTIRGPGQTGVVKPRTPADLPQYRFTPKMQEELKAARDAAQEKGLLRQGVDTAGRALLRRESPAVVHQTPGLLSQLQGALPESMRGAASAVDAALPHIARAGADAAAARPWYSQLPGVGGMLDRVGSAASSVGQLAQAFGPQVGEAAAQIKPGLLRNPMSDKIRPGSISLGATGTALAGAGTAAVELHNRGFNPVGGKTRARAQADAALHEQYPESFPTVAAASAENDKVEAALARDRAENAANAANAAPPAAVPASQPTVQPAVVQPAQPAQQRGGPPIHFLKRKGGR